MNLSHKHQQLILEIIKQHISDPNYKFFIFGSRAQGTNQPFSDVDLGVEGPQPIQPKTLYQIKNSLADSNLPFFIDVIDFNTADAKFKQIANQHKEYLQS